MRPRELFGDGWVAFVSWLSAVMDSSAETADGDGASAGIGQQLGAQRPADDDDRLAGQLRTDHVLELVRENGGRMHQSSIVSATGVSKSTVSRRLQELEADGDISRYRIGRRKLVCLPGREPAAGPSADQADERSASAD